MRVLILNEYFYPDVASTAQHSTDLARALVHDGHDVTVVAGRRGYESSAGLLPCKEIWEGIRILRVTSLGFSKTAPWQRALHFASFLLLCAWRLLWLRPHDVVVAMTTPPLLSFLAALFIRLKGGRLCIWMMDLNPDEAVVAGWLRSGGFTHRFLESLLRYSTQHADKIVVLDRFMQERVLAKGMSAETLMVLPPWSHDKMVQYDAHGRSEFRRKHGLEGKFVVMYSGNHSPCHPLDTLLVAAERLQHRNIQSPQIMFCFVGGGSLLAKIKEVSRLRSLKNVICLPYQPIEELGASLSAADLHIVVIGDPFVGVVHPCKIYNILRLGVPFLYIGPAKSHVIDMLPPGAAGDWAHLFRHGNAENVAMCVEQCASRGPRRAKQATTVAESFSEGTLIPRFVQVLSQMDLAGGIRQAEVTACGWK